MSEMAYLKVQNERECVLRMECQEFRKKWKHERHWGCNLWVPHPVSGRTGFVTYANISQLEFIPDIGLGVRVFANGPGDLGSILGRVIPKTQKMVLNTQHYKVRIKGKVEQSRERISALPYTLV